MQRSTDRILTTHTGSLPRPKGLLALMQAKLEGLLDQPAAFDAGVRTAVTNAVKRQVETGLDVINDGEQGRVDYTVYVTERLTGFEGESVPLTPSGDDFPEWAEMLRQLLPGPPFNRHPACTGSVDWKDWPAVERDLASLRDAVAVAGTADAFMTAPSPGQIARFLENRHYASDDEYLQTLADVMRREYEAIVNAGFLLQLDCPDLAFGRDAQFSHLSLEEFRKIAATHIEMLNHATANIPPDRMRMHVCWSSTGGPHHRDLELKDIADLLITARPQAIAFSGANPRHAHEWKVWRDVVTLPDDKVIIPGVIDSTSNFVEHPQLVAERIERYAGIVGRERVIAGVDCGFGTFAARVQVDSEIVWLKLASLVEGARLASSALWG